MLLTGHQPNYMPYPGFFEKIARSDRFLIVDHVQFVKRGPFGWIHRNRIRTEGGEGWSWLTVPVVTKGKYHQSIRETAIDNATPWTRKHWKTLEWNYRKAPHFSEYGPEIAALYERKWEWLIDLAEEWIRLLLRWLEIDRELERTSEMDISGKATEMVVDMCRKTEADGYLSGMHGKDYLDGEAFRSAGIDLQFQDFSCPEYPQCGSGPFVPNLSVVDMILNCGPASIDLLMGKDGRQT